ncbi:hypothetical protein phiAS5_ORF0205 [Aeromonas phage phiAS5]|uniref:Uncharacterized protein n=1 Tax=Aeromonas phage phiAS5 TaxID=879630 RepID=E1A2V2_9CAUD|nr:hypothetical protein phiAS5_ORF0205 [Aeromonas phage phiAS5]ADM80048.1 hypothetical protein phiAS5_ORF0205 [Aeromonas phage phiAS5]
MEKTMEIVYKDPETMCEEERKIFEKEVDVVSDSDTMVP